MATYVHSKRAEHHDNRAAYYTQRIVRRYREATARIRMLPDFIIAGAPKCGTTALYCYVLSHPQVVGPSKREIGFFSENFERGLNWYRACFPLRTIQSWRGKYPESRIVAGEHTPSYIMHPLAVERIAATLPHVRLIILLRDPVDRAYSHYQHEFRCGHENLSFRDAIESEPRRTANEVDRMRSEPGYRSPEYVRHAYLDQGKYRPKLETLFRYFDRNQVMIIRSETLFERTQKVLDDVLTFLSLDSFRLAEVERINSGEYQPLHAVDPAFDGELREYFGPFNESLYSLLGTNYGW